MRECRRRHLCGAISPSPLPQLPTNNKQPHNNPGDASALLLQHNAASAAFASAAAHPEISVYSGPAPPRKAVTLRTLRAKHARGEPITMVTAYDYPSAVHVRAFFLGR